jgi:arylsulfatase A-like enzyme
MKKINFINFGIAAILLLNIYSCSPTKNEDKPQQPNVIILYTDDQGTLDASCYGAEDLHTPNIDRLSRTGVKFTQAYAHTVCCPSRAAMLTGRAPQREG